MHDKDEVVAAVFENFAQDRDDHGRPAVMGVEGDDPAALDDKPAQSKIATVGADLPVEIDRGDHRVGDDAPFWLGFLDMIEGYDWPRERATRMW